MRFCFFFALSLGFLGLIAITWHVPGTASLSPAATAAEGSPYRPYRAPASTPSASLEEIHRLENCYRAQNCDVPHSDAASYHRAVSEALAIALAEHFGNFGADANLAHSAVKSDEPLVKAVGLRMLSSLPPSGENLSALENGLRNATDPALIAGSIAELRRYLGTSYEIDAQRIVEKLVGYGEGSVPPSLVAPFIDVHSYEEFRELLGHLDRAEAKNTLRAALGEYESRAPASVKR